MDYHLPDKFLFRGNMPLLNGTFAYKTIVTTMEAVLRANDFTPPSTFTLIDIRYAYSIEITFYINLYCNQLNRHNPIMFRP